MLAAGYSRSETFRSTLDELRISLRDTETRFDDASSALEEARAETAEAEVCPRFSERKAVKSVFLDRF